MQCFAFAVNFFFASVQRQSFFRHYNNTLISSGFEPCREADAQYSNRRSAPQAHP